MKYKITQFFKLFGTSFGGSIVERSMLFLMMVISTRILMGPDLPIAMLATAFLVSDLVFLVNVCLYAIFQSPKIQTSEGEEKLVFVKPGTLLSYEGNVGKLDYLDFISCDLYGIEYQFQLDRSDVD